MSKETNPIRIKTPSAVQSSNMATCIAVPCQAINYNFFVYCGLVSDEMDVEIENDAVTEEMPKGKQEYGNYFC